MPKNRFLSTLLLEFKAYHFSIIPAGVFHPSSGGRLFTLIQADHVPSEYP